MLAAFGRHEAPVLAGVPGLSTVECVFVFSGLVPNRKSHPLIHEWIAVVFRDGNAPRLIPFEELGERTGLGREPIPNLQQAADIDALAALLPSAVAEARRHFVERRNAFKDAINAKLDDEIKALDDFRARRLEQLERGLEQSKQSERVKHGRREQTRLEVQTVHDES